MATLNGKNVVLAQTGKKAPPGMKNGHVKHLQDEITFVAEVAISDIINVGKVPKGAKIQSIKVVNSASLAAGTFKVGYLATANDATDRTADICAATAFSAAGTTLVSVATDATTEEKDVIMTATIATTSGTGKTMRVVVSYVAD